jgi:regulatory protein
VNHEQPPLSLKGRALRYLSMREHSRLELGRKLARYAEEGDDVEALLDFLERNNWLSQERFAESLVHRRAGRYGNSRVLAELQQNGVRGEDLDEAESQAGRHRSGARQGSLAPQVRQRAPGRGRAQQADAIPDAAWFSQSAVRAALKGYDDDDVRLISSL